MGSDRRRGEGQAGFNTNIRGRKKVKNYKRREIAGEAGKVLH